MTDHESITSLLEEGIAALAAVQEALQHAVLVLKRLREASDASETDHPA